MSFASEREIRRLRKLLDEPLVMRENLTRYCPHKPFPKQQLFLNLQCKEAFYGGGAGPGKTDALLMAALQYVDVPGYSALILRRDFPRLNLANSIMDRAKRWLYDTDAKFNAQDKRFTFPRGAVLEFGYIDNPDDRLRYQSSEYQFIGFDEVTEFKLTNDDANPYLFMFSRLRKTEDNPVPLRMRSASNPGNVGHDWIKDRFLTQEALDALADNRPQVFWKEGRAFVPALLRDNPAIDATEYTKNLMHLPAVTRERLLNGDWSIIPDALIRSDWLRYYTMQGDMIALYRADGGLLATFYQSECPLFCTADTAGTSDDKAKEKKGKASSWSVIATWNKVPAKFGPGLILRDVWRKRVEFVDLLAGFREVKAKWHPPRIKVENAHFGPAVASALRSEMTIELVSTEGKGKTERNAPFLKMLEEGRVYLPKYENSWRPTLESEWLRWTGLDDETTDQIDVGGYAAKEFAAGGAWGGLL